MNTVVQDDFLDCSTRSSYFAIFNYTNFRYDKHARKTVFDKLMYEIGSSSRICRLEQKINALRKKLQKYYGHFNLTLLEKKALYDKTYVPAGNGKRERPKESL